MNLTDGFFEPMLLSIAKKCCEKGTPALNESRRASRRMRGRGARNAGAVAIRDQNNARLSALLNAGL
jgi:hypothetical protein